jgi:hypothetical protein
MGIGGFERWRRVVEEIGNGYALMELLGRKDVFTLFMFRVTG